MSVEQELREQLNLTGKALASDQPPVELVIARGRRRKAVFLVGSALLGTLAIAAGLLLLPRLLPSLGKEFAASTTTLPTTTSIPTSQTDGGIIVANPDGIEVRPFDGRQMSLQSDSKIWRAMGDDAGGIVYQPASILYLPADATEPEVLIEAAELDGELEAFRVVNHQLVYRDGRNWLITPLDGGEPRDLLQGFGDLYPVTDVATDGQLVVVAVAKPGCNYLDIPFEPESSTIVNPYPQSECSAAPFSNIGLSADGSTLYILRSGRLEAHDLTSGLSVSRFIGEYAHELYVGGDGSVSVVMTTQAVVWRLSDSEFEVIAQTPIQHLFIPFSSDRRPVPGVSVYSGSLVPATGATLPVTSP
jgi:hypothetical protein